MISIQLAVSTFTLLSLFGHSEATPIDHGGCVGGISCCYQGFSPGDNNGDDGEHFIQASEYLTNCEVTCKTKYPNEVTGITESIVETYSSGNGKNKNKCWCEIGAPKLDSSSANYQTCVFSSEIIGTPGPGYQFDESLGSDLEEIGVLYFRNASECCKNCKESYDHTQMVNTAKLSDTLNSCRCLKFKSQNRNEHANVYKPESFTGICGTSIDVAGGVGDGKQFDHYSVKYLTVSGVKVDDKVDCCRACKQGNPETKLVSSYGSNGRKRCDCYDVEGNQRPATSVKEYFSEVCGTTQK